MLKTLWREYWFERKKQRKIKHANKLAAKNGKRYWVIYLWGKIRVMDTARFKRYKKTRAY